MSTNFGKILVLFVVATFLFGLASSEWYFEPSNKNIEDLSNGSTSIFTADLMANVSGGNDIELSSGDISGFIEGEGSQDSNTYVIQEYSVLNSTSGESRRVNETLNYNSDLETWYAEFSTNDISMQNLTLRARGDANISGTPDSEGEEMKNISVDVNSERPDLIDVNLDYDFNDLIKADRKFKADVEVTNTSTGAMLGENDVDVSVYFHNTTDTEEVFQLNNYNDQENYHYNGEVQTPKTPGTTYIFRVNVSDSSTGNVIGSESMLVQTAPAISGKVGSVDSPGCEVVEVAEECDPGADIETGFDITEAGAEGVNLTLYKYHKASGEWINHSMVEMVESSTDEAGILQNFQSSITLPDLNTSEYSDDVRLEYYAWNRDRDYRTNHSINLNSFVIEDRSNPSAFKSREHTIRLFLGQKHSRGSYNKSRFQNLEVNMTGPETNETSYSMSDFEYIENDGSFENSVVIPEDSANGAYNLDIGAENIYGEYKEISRGLQVRDVNSTFSADSELDLEYETPGLFTENITLENLVDSEKTLDIYNSHENISVQDEVTLGSGAQKDISFDINLSTPGSFETEIEFADSEASYNETTDINVQGPQCEIYEDDLCINQSDINVDTNESSGITQDISITNFGDENQIVNTSITGNATEAFNTTEQFNVSDSTVLEVEFNPDTQGSYEGDLEMDWGNKETSIGLMGMANFSEVDVGLETNPASIDMGVVPETQPFTTELDIENTGDTAINDIAASSASLDLQIDEFDLAPGESETIDISISTPQTGSIRFSGESSEGEVRTDVTVDGDVVEDYSERTDEITERVTDLRNRTDNEDLESTLTDVSGMVTQIESDWDSGNYAESRSTFQDAQDELESIERELNSQQQDENGGEGDQEESGGGPPILPIVLILVILLGIGGFVFYESYIPEEGDPLYGVLGEQ